MSYNKRRHTMGFTLIELMVTVAIVGLLASVAIPSFSQYVVRGKLADATAQLSDLRLRMEQFRQDNRSYLSGEACAVDAPDSAHFNFACVATASNFTWTASNLDGQGLGGASSYVYTINQDGSQQTTAFDGASSTAGCWLTNSEVC